MKHVKTRPISMLVAALALATISGEPALAAPSYTATASPAHGGRSSAGTLPIGIVRASVRSLGRYLSGVDAGDTTAIRSFVEAKLAPHFDFPYMARWAAGPFYGRLTGRSRRALAEKIELMFVQALTRNLGVYSTPPPRVQVFPAVSRGPRGERVVRARVLPRAGYPILLSFRFYRSSGGAWRVFDVQANGFSALAYYRRYFAALVRRAGPGALSD